jgi:EAL domain-containing protein (putative c-di-GMP-specific phosphodiesterase class I)
MKTPFPVAGRELLARASIGIAFSDSSVSDADEIIGYADAAMYHAKNQSETAYRLFDRSMIEQNTQRLELGTELANAIRREELTLHFQPIINTTSWLTDGFEALLRWNHPVHGSVSPATFIPIAESNGLILEIGLWVLRAACTQATKWNKQFARDVMVCVNVSMRQLGSIGFVESVASILETTQLEPRLLKLEVTESLLMQSPEETIDLLMQLRATGVSLAIDDFGTGYSSLSYLHQMPLDVLKIDRSFVSQMCESQKHLAIVRTIVGLANSLSLRVVAEGVESAEQASLLTELGCDFLQGFLYSKAVSSSVATALIQSKWNSPAILLTT